MIKTCQACGLTKPVEDFYGPERKKHPNCKVCFRAKSSINYLTNRETILARRKLSNTPSKSSIRDRSAKFYASIRGRAIALLSSAQRNSKTPCTLTLEHILAGLETGRCAVTGIEFDFERHPSNKKNAYSPSIDRRDPRQGYTNENVQIVIWQYNMMKGEISHAELVAICRKVIDHESA